MYTQYLVHKRKVVGIRTNIPKQINLVDFIFMEHSSTHPKYEVWEYDTIALNVICILHKKIQYGCSENDSFISLVCNCDTRLSGLETAFPSVDFSFVRNIEL